MNARALRGKEMSCGQRLTLSGMKRCGRTCNPFPLFMVFKAIAAIRQLLALHQLDEISIGSYADVRSFKSENPSRANFAPWFAEMYSITPRSKANYLATTATLCISCEPYVILAPEHVVSLVFLPLMAISSSQTRLTIAIGTMLCK